MQKTKNEVEKYQFPQSVVNPQIYLEYNYNRKNNINEAEYKALMQIESNKKKNELKISKKKEFKKRYNEMALSYQDEQKKKNQEEEYIKKAERLQRLQKLHNFNKTLQEKNTKKKIINNNKHLIWVKTENNKNKNETKNESNKYNNNPIIVINHDNKEDDIVNLKKVDSTFIAKKTILKSVTSDNKDENKDIIIDNNANNKNITDNFMQKKTVLKSSEYLTNDDKKLEDLKEYQLKENENIIDLRTNLEYMINSQNIKNNFIINNKSDIKEQINERIDNLKRFRYEGLFPEKNEQIKKKKKKIIIKNRKYLSEFEKKRYIKALKNIFTERLGEHNIYIQNICSCGNLQKQLTAIVEKGNLTVYALTELECANNCVFYKNKNEYMKNINDVLNSIKNIKYENFHNKYKENI